MRRLSDGCSRGKYGQGPGGDGVSPPGHARSELGIRRDMALASAPRSCESVLVASDPNRDSVMQSLLSNHQRFLDFLERRTKSRVDAEDVLQSAFAKALEKGKDLRSGESAVAWFYRLLRNALVDRYRSDASQGHALESKTDERDHKAAEDAELRGEVCRCVMDLLPTLKVEYAEILRRVDLEGEPVKDAAKAAGITPNHAGVRLHRARKALLREGQRSCRTCATHGCLDCSCGQHET